MSDIGLIWGDSGAWMAVQEKNLVTKLRLDWTDIQTPSYHSKQVRLVLGTIMLCLRLV